MRIVEPIWRKTEVGVVCQHGTEIDVHCCGCHSGFLFFPENCRCLTDPPDGGETKEAA